MRQVQVASVEPAVPVDTCAKKKEKNKCDEAAADTYDSDADAAAYGGDEL